MTDTTKTRDTVFLSCRGIEKIFRNGESSLKVLKNIDLDIYDNEIVAIAGHSGAGKSTLLHILGTLDTPTSGEVTVRSTDVFALSEREQARFRNKTIGFIFQFHHLLPEFSARENVAMPLLVSTPDSKAALDRAERLLREVGLGERINHKPSELSGGERQRVAFARAMVADPELIMADEPSGNLDIHNSKALHQLMWDLVREKNKTLIIVTHNRELASRADRTVELYDGKVRNNIET